MTQIYCVAAPTRQLMENMVVMVARILELCYVSQTVCYCGCGQVVVVSTFSGSMMS